MKELLNFVDYLYEPVYDVEGDEFFLYLKDGVWQVLMDRDVIFQTQDENVFLEFVQDAQLNMDQLRRYLLDSVCTKAVWLRMQQQQIEKVVGKDTVDYAYDSWMNFGDQLKKILKKHTSTLELVK